MRYRRVFDPPLTVRLGAPAADGLGDRQDGVVYVFTEEIVLAVNVALAARRPLLVSGDPGTGKSSLALVVAAFMEWRYEGEIITPRTQATELQWRFDALRRLRDAQANRLQDDAAYVEPGVLWRAFDGGADRRRAVILLDEIDKADPDVPNSLLGALGSMTFRVTETGQEIEATADAPPFVVLTTNNERELPRPFVRRCVTLHLEPPQDDRLLAIADAHGLRDARGLDALTAERVVALRDEAVPGRPAPSAAEYLDALRACQELDVRPSTSEWEAVMTITLRKGTDAGR